MFSFYKMSAEEVAAAFVNHYYSTLGSNPSALMGLYVSYYLLVVLLFHLLFHVTSNC